MQGRGFGALLESGAGDEVAVAGVMLGRAVVASFRVFDGGLDALDGGLGLGSLLTSQLFLLFEAKCFKFLVKER